MRTFHRGEIWRARLAEPIGQRPVLLLSRPESYLLRTEFLACQVTTRVRGLPVEVRLGRAEGLGRPCVANLDAIYTIVSARLVRLVGRLKKERRTEVFAALRIAVGMP